MRRAQPLGEVANNPDGGLEDVFILLPVCRQLLLTSMLMVMMKLMLWQSVLVSILRQSMLVLVLVLVLVLASWWCRGARIGKGGKERGRAG